MQNMSLLELTEASIVLQALIYFLSIFTGGN